MKSKSNMNRSKRNDAHASMKNMIHSKYDDLVDPKSLKDNPKNRNKHGSDQIERLAELYKYHGVRHPIIVSKLSGCIVAGHGRKLAAIRAGIKKMPVVYQDFKNADAEYAFIQSDNAIALWSDLDISAIDLDVKNLDVDFNVDMLGIKNFVIDPIDPSDDEFNPSDSSEEDRPHKVCPHCGEAL